MTKGEATIWLMNISADIGKSEHHELWHYEQALYEIREMLEAEAQLSQEDTTKDTTFGKWIPVSEQLPETDDMMLVTAQPKKGKPNVNRAFYMDGSWHGSGSMAGVTAWMPLPKPYEENHES